MPSLSDKKFRAIQNLKGDYHDQRSPITTNPNNIKLETPVSLCQSLLSHDLSIHVGQHSLHGDLAGRFARDLSLLQNIHTSYIAHTFSYSTGTTGSIPESVQSTSVTTHLHLP
jgi:hypothetical protein